MRAGFYIRRWIRRPAIPPPSFSAAGFYRGTGVEGGGFRGLKLGGGIAGAGFYRGTGVEGGVSGVEGGFLHPPPPSISSGAGSAAQLYRRPATARRVSPRHGG